MITATQRFALFEDSQVLYSALECKVYPFLDIDTEIVRVEIRVLATIGTSVFLTGGSYTKEFTFAELLAFTASGSDEIEQFYNLCEQAAKDYLENIPENSAVTFAIV